MAVSRVSKIMRRNFLLRKQSSAKEFIVYSEPFRDLFAIGFAADWRNRADGMQCPLDE